MKPKTDVKVGFGVQHQNDDDVLIRNRADVEPLLDLNAYRRNYASSPPIAGMQPMASIPSHIMDELYRKGIGPKQDSVRFKRWLEAHPKFKTTNKKVWRPT